MNYYCWKYLDLLVNFSFSQTRIILEKSFPPLFFTKCCFFLLRRLKGDHFPMIKDWFTQEKNRGGSHAFESGTGLATWISMTINHIGLQEWGVWKWKENLLWASLRGTTQWKYVGKLWAFMWCSHWIQWGLWVKTEEKWRSGIGPPVSLNFFQKQLRLEMEFYRRD